MNNYHVTLINPPFIFANEREVVFSQCLGLSYIAARLKQQGHNVTILDAFFEGKESITHLNDNFIKVGLANKDIIARIPKNTDIIGVSVPFSHLSFIAHDLIKDIKESFPLVPLVIGGVYPSTQYRLAMQTKADYIILGEGEVAICELIDYLVSRGSKPLPKGVISNRGHLSNIDNITPVYVDDLDRLPFPARELLFFGKLAITKSQRLQIDRTASIITSRGCPFDCNFCSVHPVCGYKWRPRSVQNILNEIDELVNNYEINTFEIEDDNFTLNKQRAVEILEGFIKRSNNKQHKRIGWTACNGVRIDTLDEEIMDIIARSNCLHFAIALEHGDKEILDLMNKKLDPSKTLEVVKLIKKFEIPANIFIIYGYPGETKRRFQKGLDFYIKLKKIAPKINFSFFIAQPYPGTKLFELCVREGYLKKDTFNDINKIPVFSTDNLYLLRTAEFDINELKRRRRVLERTLQPGIYIRKRIRNALPARIRPGCISLYRRIKKLI